MEILWVAVLLCCSSSWRSAATSMAHRNDKVVSLPLLPHHVVERRRRRQRRRLPNEVPNDRRPRTYAERRRYLEKDDEDEDEDDDEKNNEKKKKKKKEDADFHQQVGSLYQGYGTHYVDLWVGTPPQRQTVIVDTGSGVTAFPCLSCRNCGQDYHIDGSFVNDESASFSVVPCDDCMRGHCNGSDQKKCHLSMSYQEGSSWFAYEARDYAYAAGPHFVALSRERLREDGDGDGDDDEKEEEHVGMVPVRQEDGDNATTHYDPVLEEALDPATAARHSFRLTFGCQTSLKGLFLTQLADGILGMERAPSSFWAQMHAAGALLQRRFSLCFTRQPVAEFNGTAAGTLTLGGVDRRLHTTPMVYAKDVRKNGFFAVRLQGVYLRDGAAGTSVRAAVADAKVVEVEIEFDALNAGGVIVDSGTTDTYMTHHLARPFREAWKLVVGREFWGDEEGVRLTHDQLLRLPTVLLEMESAPGSTDRFETIGEVNAVAGLAGSDLDPDAPRSVVVAFPPTHYMEYDPILDAYFPRIYFDEDKGSVLGANFMAGHDVFFDAERNRLGWAESACDYLGLVTGGLDHDFVYEDGSAESHDASYHGGVEIVHEEDRYKTDDEDEEGICASRTCNAAVFCAASIVLAAIFFWRQGRRRGRWAHAPLAVEMAAAATAGGPGARSANVYRDENDDDDEDHHNLPSLS